LTKLNKERDALIKDSTKVEDKIANMNNTLKETTEKLDKVTNHINELQAEFNKSHDTAVMEEINQASKEQQSLQKSQTNCQKSLLNLRNDLAKIIDKLTKNALAIEKAENELKTLKN
jgi:predicted  nucleic acid-binding Zn-ribbon protein